MFWKKKPTAKKAYDYTKEYPVIRSSICTGEQVAGFKDRNSGHFREIMCIRSEADRQLFMAEYQVKAEEIRREW